MATQSVLFVEDDRTTRSVIKRVVKAEPYQSFFASNGPEAIEIMETHKMDVVVTDLIMPEMDGFKLLWWVKKNRPEAIRVILSSVKDTDALLDAINQGAVYRYLVKPWKNRDFRIVVRQSLEMSAIRQERNRLMTDLESANRKLQETLQYRTNQVLDLYNQAEIGKHAAQIVHNLNNPLMAIFGALDLSKMALELDPPDHKLLSKMNGTLSKSAENLQKIVRTVLLHAKDPSLFQNEALDMNAMIEDEMEFFNLNSVFKKKVKKQVDLQADLPPVFGNFIQIKQIFANLIKNASDAMEETPEKKFGIKTSYGEGWVQIQISDTGEGIAPENLDKIFQADFSTKPKDKGTGLGLASVRSMVSAYNGKVDVQSLPGTGTTFTVRLPAYRPSSES